MHARTLPIFSLFLCLFFSPPAEARDHAGQFSVGAGAGLVTEAPWATEPFRDAVKPGPRGTLFGRWHYLSHNSGLELSYDHFAHGGNDLTSRSLIASYFWRYDLNGPVHPVVGFGLGHSWTRNYFRTGAYDTTVFRIRVGAEIELSPRLDLAVHVDQFVIFKNFGNEPNLVSLAPTVSIVRYFGSYYAPEEFEAAREGKPYPPVPAVVAPPPVSWPGPVAAVPTDGDGDGVPDGLDRCPNTANGVKVNALGCGSDQRFNITPELQFASRRAELPAGAEEALTEAVTLLRDHPFLVAEVQGHTDTVGSEESNAKLSLARAEVVRRYLVEHFGIASERLSAKGYGADYPIAASDAPAQRARNRRTVLRFSTQP